MTKKETKAKLVAKKDKPPMSFIPVIPAAHFKGHDGLVTMARLCQMRTHADYDAFIAITGTEGVGKSVLDILLAYLVQTDGVNLAKSSFDLYDNVIYSGNRQLVAKKIKELPRFSAVCIDEAIKHLYKRNFMDKMQIFLNVVAAVCRKLNKLVFLCLPDFNDLDTFYRNHRVKWWIHVYDRGHAVVLEKSKNPAATDKWYLKEFNKSWERLTKRKKTHEVNAAKQLSIFKRQKTYFFDFTFPDLPKEIGDKYKQIAIEKSSDIYNVKNHHGVREKLYRDGLMSLVAKLYTEGGLTQRALADQTGLSLGAVSKLLQDAAKHEK